METFKKAAWHAPVAGAPGKIKLATREVLISIEFITIY